MVILKIVSASQTRRTRKKRVHQKSLFRPLIGLLLSRGLSFRDGWFKKYHPSPAVKIYTIKEESGLKIKSG